MAIFCFKEKDETINTFVTGKVSRDPETRTNSKGSVIKFSVAYGKKKYMNVEAWEDSDVGIVASMLEKGDVVGVAGTYRSWEYNGKDYSSITADAIFPMSPPASEIQSPLMPDKQDQAASGAYEELPDSQFEDDLPFERRVTPPVTKGEKG